MNYESDDSDDDDASESLGGDSISSSESFSKGISKDDDGPHDAFDSFRFWMPKIWEHYQPQLLSDIVRVAYLLSPDPLVMAHSADKENIDPQDRLAMENLIRKMFVPRNMLRAEDREREEARLIHKLWQEYADFTSKQGFFKSKHIWITAESGDCLAHVWHKNYSLPYTEVLGKLGCRVCSTLLGIGEAERHWKVTKRNKEGQRARLGVARTKKQSAISAAYSHEKSAVRRLAASKAGKLYEDTDFDQFTGEGVWEDRKPLATRIFRAWYESWEDAQLNSAGDDRFAAALSAKYGGLKFHDEDGVQQGFDGPVNGYTLEDNCCVLVKLDDDSHEQPMKKFGYKYCILLCFPGFDVNKSYLKQPNKYWAIQELFKDCDFYGMIQDYYKQHPKEAEDIGLRIYTDDGIVDELTEKEAVQAGESKKRKKYNVMETSKASRKRHRK